jgi:hypothetical protein
LRRKSAVIISTLAIVAIGATAAYAAGGFNNYAGTTMSFNKGVGTKSKPVGIGFTQSLVAKNNDATKAAAVLIDIKTKIYGLVSNAKKFPTCSGTKIAAQKSDTFCPKASKFAVGGVNSLLGDPTLALNNRVPCNPGLDVFNGGGGKLWFFFTTNASHVCAGGALHTGDTPPYPGTVKQQGKFEVVDVPLPPFVSTKVANQANFYGSLIKEQLKWFKVSTKVHGKTVFNNVSTGCQKGKRPWSVTFTSTTNGSDRSVQTVTGSSKC